MSDTKHTPEPWKITDPDQNGLYGVWSFDGRHCIAEGLYLEDARRIVACVNACAGMADPENEILSLRAEIDRAYSMLEAHNVPRERAKSIANGIDVLTTRYGKAETCWNMERSALRAAAEKAIN